MKKILIYAAPFCYGPAGKALAIASHLIDIYKVSLSGFNSSYDLMRLDDGDQKIECMELSPNEISNEKLLQYDLVISISDLKFALRVKELGLKSIMIDSIFSSRFPVYEEICLLDAYIVQEFLGVQEVIETLPKQCETLLKVGAIFRKDITKLVTNNRKENHILINYGGMESPTVQIPQDSKYPYIMTDILVPLFKQKPETMFTVTGPSHIMETLSTKYINYYNVQFRTMRNSDFIECIAQSQLVLSTPGITSFYEICYSDTPSIFLLPHNSTQYLQLTALIEKNMESPKCHYNFYGPSYSKNDLGKVRIALESFNRLYTSKDSLNNYKKNLFNMINIKMIKKVDGFELNKQKYIKRVGLNGGEAILSRVNQILQ